MESANGKGKFQRLCTLGLALWALGCSGAGEDGDPHAGHANQGVPSGAGCPSESRLDYETFGAAFLGKYCIACHSSSLAPAEREGAPFGADYDSLSVLIESGVEHVDYVAAAGPDGHNDFMPPADFPQQPTLGERQALGEWLACGAP
jgi:hypothetical protein